MNYYYRLRNGMLIWRRRGSQDARLYLRGQLGCPNIEYDEGDWRLIVPLMCDSFSAKIAIRLDEPEFQTLSQAFSRVKLFDTITIYGSGQVETESGVLSEVINVQSLTEQNLLDIADILVEKLRRGIQSRLVS